MMTKRWPEAKFVWRTLLIVPILIGTACSAPTVVPTPTSAPAPTPTPTSSGQYHDDFTDPDSGWPKETGDGYKVGYHPPDVFHVEVSVPNRRRTAFLPNQSFEEVTVETDVRVDHTSTPTSTGDFRYGLALRASEDQYYAFLISPRTQTWQVVKNSAQGVNVLAQGADDSIQGLNAKDLLRVDASGPSFTFHINDHSVTQVYDADYASGQAGFIVETLDETLAHIHYDSLTIRQVEVVGQLYRDDFTDPDSGWPKETGDGYKIGYHPPDVYHVEVSIPNRRRTAFLPNQSFEEVTVETDVRVDHTSTPTSTGDFRYGLALRASGDRYYAFTISPRTKIWQVLKSSPSGMQVLAQGTDDSIQGLEAQDTLSVDASGPTFRFHVNGQLIAQVKDPEYTSGAVGFIVETFDESLAHLHYDSLTIRKVALEEIATGPTATPIPEATPAPPTVAPTPTPFTPPEGMVLIPAGYFRMGSASGQANERPEHPVLLDAFYIDRFEVTNASYRECVNAGACTPSRTRSSFTHSGYRDDPAYDNYPVLGVTWEQADDYCAWAGKRLPTEAEWEYAASGPDNLVWPWGNTFDPSLSAASAPDAQPVDSYPAGASPFGVLNMAGNVAEWVADGYEAAFYANSPASNPVNEVGGGTRIYRGGSFANTNSAFYTTSRRYLKSRTFSDVDIGFRCAKDAPEVKAATPPEKRDALVKEFCQIFAADKPGAPCP